MGSAVGQELLGAGHQVLGLARPDKPAEAPAAAGAEAHRGLLEDLASLQRRAAAADGIIYLGFVHDFASFAAAAETDRRAVEALGEALAGPNQPLITTGGVLRQRTPGHLATAQDAPH